VKNNPRDDRYGLFKMKENSGSERWRFETCISYLRKANHCKSEICVDHLLLLRRQEILLLFVWKQTLQSIIYLIRFQSSYPFIQSAWKLSKGTWSHTWCSHIHEFDQRVFMRVIMRVIYYLLFDLLSCIWLTNFTCELHTSYMRFTCDLHAIYMRFTYEALQWSIDPVSTS